MKLPEFKVKSLQFQLVTGTFIVVTALVVFGVLYFPIQHRRLQIEGFRNSLNSQGQTISQTIAVGLRYNDFEAIYLAFDLAREDQSLLHIIVLDSDGDLVIASYPENAEINLKDYNVPGLTEGELSLTQVSEITGNDELYGYIVLSKSFDQLNEQIAASRVKIIIIGLLLGLLGLFIALIFSQAIVMPLSRLTYATKAIAGGNYSVEIPLSGYDEVSTLGHSFNDMTIRVQTTLLEITQARAELEKALEAAKESDQLKSDFLASTSHELRTPLNSIIGFQKLYLDGMCDSPEEEREFISHALQSSHHLLGLINSVLDIARIEAGRMEIRLERVNIDEVFHEVYLMTHVQAEQKKLDLEFSSYDGGNICVKANNKKLMQVLVNLVGNSIKFTSEGGIKVSAESLPDNGLARIQVTDNGIGIPPDEQKKVFDKFTRAKRPLTKKFAGTGLELSISRHLVELMEGSIDLSSAGLDQGTTVTIELPLS